MAKSARTGKVFVDWSQNNTKKTTVAPYSLRARPDAPGVSTPLSWREIETAKHPNQFVFSPEQVLERAERHGDLLADLLDPALAATLN
jgi:bifunctional non-homologous end joining protein LigD